MKLIKIFHYFKILNVKNELIRILFVRLGNLVLFIPNTTLLHVKASVSQGENLTIILFCNTAHLIPTYCSTLTCREYNFWVETH